MAVGPYQPIACALHEQLEFSVLRRVPLLLEYRQDNRVRQEQVLPSDVYTREGAEWLKFRRDDGSEEAIRLDAILSFCEALER
jgi:Rho-binding antiterminator